jgi:K+/H+ antiporter YhaU regulatory subunit KhtT
MAVKFELEENEAVFIVQVLGQLPTQSNAFPLYQKALQQLQSQQSDVEATPETVA